MRAHMMCGTGSWDRFIGRRSLTKCLQFSLIPMWDTMSKIEEGGFLERDKERDKDLAPLKKLVDLCHKDYIEMALENSTIDWTGLQRALTEGSDLEKTQKSYRRQIVSVFRAGANKMLLDQLFHKELLTTLLPVTLAKHGCSSADRELVARFEKFLTLLSKYNKARQNLYSDKEKATAIGYRIVHENFPRFINNLYVFESIKQTESQIIRTAEKNLAAFMVAHGIGSLSDVFNIGYYNRALTQGGIDFYNTLLGGFTYDGGNIQGLNQLVNLYNQLHPEARLPLFVPLYKQLLGDSESASFRQEPYKTDAEVIDAIDHFVNDVLHIGRDDSTIRCLRTQFAGLDDFDADKMRISKNDLTALSQSVCGSWCFISDALKQRCSTKKEEKALDKQRYFSLGQIRTVADYSEYWNIDEFVKRVEEAHAALRSLWITQTHKQGELRPVTAAVKELLDSLLDLYHRVEILKDSEDPYFLSEVGPNIKTLEGIVPLYNRTRSYLTQKTGDTVSKFRLTFDVPELCSGWDMNKEQSHCIVLFFHNGKYYLGIINPQNKVNFTKVQKTDKEKGWKKLRYRQLRSAHMSLPHSCFPKKSTPNGLTDEIREIYETYKAYSSHNADRDKGQLRKELSDEQRTKLIDYYKFFISSHEEWSVFGFQFKDATEYRSVSEFYADVDRQSYKLAYDYIDEDVIKSLVSEGKLFLFEIYNKDFADGATGASSLHTMFWREVFSEANASADCVRLNGGAELFYRTASSKKMAVHEVGDVLVNRTTSDGEPLPSDVYRELVAYYANGETGTLSDEAASYLGRVVTKVANHRIVKDRRFTQPMFKLHVPITINHRCDDRDFQINRDVLDVLRTQGHNITVLGIDRGEKNLLYISLVDIDGNIIMQKSLNIVGYRRHDGKLVRYDYQRKLDQREKERLNERRSWKSVSNIKDLKAGYLSHVISELVRLVIDYNAIVVMEDLNSGFKQSRCRIEKQIYQKFEKALLDKLGYLAFKDVPVDANGGILRGYQLTPKFDSFKKLGKQAGIVFYVPAAYTSKTDPTTGFRNCLRKVKYESVEKAKKFIDNNIMAFRYNADEGYFEFDVHESRKATKNSLGVERDWTICTHGDLRWVWNAIEKKTEAVNVTLALKELFDQYSIAYADGGDIKTQMTNQDQKGFFAPLMRLIAATLQMRYTNNNAENVSEQDFILSPVKNEKGEFYDTRTSDGTLPIDGDANGAYNIAMRGVVNLRLYAAERPENSVDTENREDAQAHNQPRLTECAQNDPARV